MIFGRDLTTFIERFLFIADAIRQVILTLRTITFYCALVCLSVIELMISDLYVLL